MQKLFTLIPVLLLLHSCGLAKAIDYSFYVPEHGEYEIDGLYAVQDAIALFYWVEMWFL